MDLKLNLLLKAPKSFKTVESVFIDVRYNQVCDQLHYVLSN